MSFHVEWMPIAEQELAAAWAASLERAKLTRLIDELDRRLESDPFDVGESRSNPDVRIWIEAPIGIEFVVNRRAKHVLVTGVFEVKRR